MSAENYILAVKDGINYLLDMTGRPVKKIPWPHIQPVSEGLFAASRDGRRWGYINAEGKELIAPRYKSAGPFYDGLACVEENPVGSAREGLKGYIYKSGKSAIDFRFSRGSHFRYGLALAGEGERKEDSTGIGYINRNGDFKISPRFSLSGEFSESGLAPAEENGQWGFINKKGDWYISPRFSFASIISEDTAVVRTGSFAENKLEIINSRGKQLSDYQGEFKNISDFHDGYAVAELKGPHPQFSSALLDKTGKICFHWADKLGRRFSDGLVNATRDGRWGYLNAKGEIVIPFEFDNADPFYFGVAPVCRDGYWGDINQDREELTDIIYDKIVLDYYKLFYYMK